MTTENLLTERQIRNVKKFSARAIRDAGIHDPNRFAPQTFEWRDLAKAQNDLAKAWRDVLDGISDGTPQTEMDARESCHDGLLELHDAIKQEMDYRDQLGDRSARPDGDRVDQMPTRAAPTGGDREVRGDGSVSRSGGGGEAEEAVALRPDQRMADRVSRRGNVGDYKDLSVGAYLRSMVTGASNDVEHRALSQGSDSGGGFSVPQPLAAELLDLLRSRTVTVQAGARTVDLTSDVNDWAKIVADPTPGWRAEGDAVPESQPTFGRVRFEPRMLSVMVKVSRELLEDSVNIRAELPRIISQAMAVELDRVLLFGSGSSNEPLGLFNDPNIQEVSHGAALASYSPLVKARTKIKSANATPGAYIMHPRDEGTLADLTDTPGQPLQVPPALSELPMLTTTSVPTDLGGGTDSVILHGDWRFLLVGMRTDLRIEVLRERYAENMQYAYLAHMRVDTARVHSDAFAKITGIAAP